MPHSTQPIGIFDSGIGGLTIAHALVQHLPEEDIVYFGDTAHLPYGDKSAAAIQAYSVKIAHMLLQQGCKLILIACNSASAAAFELVKEYVGSQALVVNVIDPVISYLQKNFAHKHLGLIGTKQTVNSNVYKKKLDAVTKHIRLTVHTTNLLAAAIEEFGNHPVIDSLLKEYLSIPKFKEIDALILACTHYPIIKEKIKFFCGNHIQIIDPSQIVAERVKDLLKSAQLLTKNGSGLKKFYVSDLTQSFSEGTKLFFPDNIHLEHYPLWD
jgi:glutamate racemase